MARQSSRLFAAILVTVLGALLFSACASRQVRQAPPGFEAGAPIFTGDEALDARVARARRLTEIDEAELAALHKAASSTRNGQQATFDLAAVYLARGDVGSALEALMRWAEVSDHSDTAMAAYIDVAIGADRLEDCITGTDSFLQVHRGHPWVFIARGVCLEKFNRMAPARNAYIQGLGNVRTIGGHTGTLEREIGLTAPPENVTEDALYKDRLALLDVLAAESLVGHVALRHRTEVQPDEVPIDRRLSPLGGITTAEIDRIFAGRSDAFRHCQLLSAGKRTIPGGRLVTHLTISRDGSPRDIEHVRSTFDVEEVPACLDQQTLNLWFPQPRYGKAVRYEREFRMAGD